MSANIKINMHFRCTLGYVACFFFCVTVSVKFRPTCVHVIYNSVCVAEYVSLYFDYLIILVISNFGFEGWVLVLTASVPGLCIHFTSIKMSKCMVNYEFVSTWIKIRYDCTQSEKH